MRIIKSTILVFALLMCYSTHGSDLTSSPISNPFSSTRYYDANFIGATRGIFVGGSNGSQPISWNALEDGSGNMVFSGTHDAAMLTFSHWNKLFELKVSENSNPTAGTNVTWKQLLQIQSDPDNVMKFCGKFFANEINVNTFVSFCDYVFYPDYKLMPLDQLNDYIKLYLRLPEIPSARQIAQDGIDVSELLTLQMKKIEELTLYTIEQNNRISELEDQIERIEALEAQLSKFVITK